jgi:hypothetical protein
MARQQNRHGRATVSQKQADPSKKSGPFSVRSEVAWNIQIEGDTGTRPSIDSAVDSPFAFLVRISLEVDPMRKSLTALAAAATFAAAAVAAPTTADARWGWRGGAFIGGLAAGAVIGGALARPYYGGYYGGYYNSYYYPGPAYYNYYAPAPVYYDYYAAPQPYYGCWRFRYGYRYRVC